MIKKLIAIMASVMPGPIKISLYRLIGYKIGKNVKINFMALVLANKVKIEDNARIGPLNILKMDELSIGENSVIRGLNMIVGPRNLKIGKRSQIVGPFTFMNLAEDIEIGDRSGIGSHSIFYTHGVHLPYTEGNPRKFGKISIENDVWSPTHVIFLPGVRIGKNSIIAAGSLVKDSFPKNSFIAGNPAKRISDVSKIKKIITPEILQDRINEIIKEFSRNSHFANFKIESTKGKLMLKNNSKRYVVTSNQEVNSLKKDNSKEVIIFGKNIRDPKDKRVSTFDLANRRMRISGELGKIFLSHLESYGEYFD